MKKKLMDSEDVALYTLVKNGTCSYCYQNRDFLTGLTNGGGGWICAWCAEQVAKILHVKEGNILPDQVSQIHDEDTDGDS